MTYPTRCKRHPRTESSFLNSPFVFDPWTSTSRAFLARRRSNGGGGAWRVPGKCWAQELAISESWHSLLAERDVTVGNSQGGEWECLGKGCVEALVCRGPEKLCGVRERYHEIELWSPAVSLKESASFLRVSRGRNASPVHVPLSALWPQCGPGFTPLFSSPGTISRESSSGHFFSFVFVRNLTPGAKSCATHYRSLRGATCDAEWTASRFLVDTVPYICVFFFFSVEWVGYARRVEISGVASPSDGC